MSKRPVRGVPRLVAVARHCSVKLDRIRPGFAFVDAEHDKGSAFHAAADPKHTGNFFAVGGTDKRRLARH